MPDLALDNVLNDRSQRTLSYSIYGIRETATVEIVRMRAISPLTLPAP
jgi:hypothetical protein